MHFDDRLATVLRARGGGEAVSRIQFRQLVDLLGTLPAEARSEAIDAGFVRLAELNRAIPATERAAALRERGLRLRSPRLLAELASAEPDVAIAAMRTAQLGEGEWLDLIPALPVQVRGLVRQRRDLGPQVEKLLARLGIADLALPPSSEAGRVAANDPGVQVDASPTAGGIGAIVQRIEAYRRRKATMSADLQQRSPIVSDPVASFAFECDEAGKITWADGTASGAVVGLSLRQDAGLTSAAIDAVDSAFRRRQPLNHAHLTLAGGPVVAGDWVVDAAPQFDAFGRFTGYLGRFRRPASADRTADPRHEEADRLRQVLHELRTPVNAIQGFAEVIQQQLFGPLPHEYRAHAAAIAGDAARMLAGFDELDRLARLDTGALKLEEGESDFAEVSMRLADQLAAYLAGRNASFVAECAPGDYRVDLARPEAERMVWRLLAVVAGAAAPGETLKLKLSCKKQLVRLDLTMPAALARQDDIFRTEPPAVTSAVSASQFGSGFALRIVASEARAGGGELSRSGQKLKLRLPLVTSGLTGDSEAHTHDLGSPGL